MLNALMAAPTSSEDARIIRTQAGFSLPELLISVTILLIISSAVTSALLQMTSSQQTIANRTQLHAGVRSATELLQQEIGQAGRIALPGTQPGGSVTLGAAVVAASTTATVSCGGSPTGCGIFPGELLVVDPGGWNQATQVGSEETVEVASIAGNQITIDKSVDSTGATIQVSFVNPHISGAAVRAIGGFSSGIVPPASSGFTNGSTDSVLKLYGDINGDGNMVYVEYSCDPLPGSGNLYRNVMAYDQASAKLAPTDSQVLLTGIQSNPNGTPCFTYMPSPLPTVSGTTYVLDVAITLTVRTQSIDPVTKQYQTETKALLNVSPRNVFNVWQLASSGAFNRVQPMPPTVTALLP
jgi:prepilin-type N-terminal cleavage/methylation domain-containing protein